MSNEKRLFKPIGKYIIVHSKGKIKESSKLIAMPDGMKDTYRSRRIWEDNENIVYAKGDEVTKVNVGDRLFLDAHVKLRRLKELTEFVENKLGISFKVDIRDAKGILVNTEETEKYFAILEEDIIAVIN